MNTPRFPYSLCIIGIAVCTFASTAFGDEPFEVFRDGQARASIVLPDDAPEDVRTAVDVFRDLLHTGYGVDVPVGAPDELANRIELVVEDRAWMDEDKATVTFPDAHTMRITGGRSGVIRTLFVLLEKHAGLRYLYQAGAEHRIHYPPMGGLGIPRKTFMHDSAFEFGRETDRTRDYNGPPENRTRTYFWNWEAMLGGKARFHYRHALGSKGGAGKGNHGIVFPIHEYAAAEEKPADAIFPIRNGERYLPYEDAPRQWHRDWQPCFTSQASVDEAAANIIDYVEANPDTQSVAMGVNDLGGHCECEDCLAMDQHDTYNTQRYRNRSESYYRWVNKVTERVNERFRR